MSNKILCSVASNPKEGGRQILGLNKAFTVVHRDRHGLEVALGKKRKASTKYHNGLIKLISMNIILDTCIDRLQDSPSTRGCAYSAIDLLTRIQISGRRRVPSIVLCQGFDARCGDVSRPAASDIR